MKKTTRKLLTAFLSALSLCAIGFGVGLSQNLNAAAVNEDASVIEMVSGAQVRTISTSQLAETTPAIRFTAKLSDDAVEKINQGTATAGMLVFPEAYMDRYNAQTEVTDYKTFFENAPHFRFTYKAENLYAETVDGVTTYYIRGAVSNVQFANLDRKFIAIAYVEYSDGTVTYAPVKDDSGEYCSARSLAYVASSALNNGQTYTIIQDDGTTTTPVMDWLNATAYKKYGVSYDKNAADGKYYGYNGVWYTYEELTVAFPTENVVNTVYQLKDWELPYMFEGETYSLQTDNLAELNVQYTSSDYTKMSSDGAITFNDDIPAEIAGITVTAQIGTKDAGYFLNTTTTEGITVKQIPDVTLADLQAGVTYDWYNTYMRIGNQSGYVAQRRSIEALREDAETADVAAALDAASSQNVVMHLTDDYNYLYGLENLLKTRSGSDTGMRNLYTVEFWYYSTCDTHAYFVAMDKDNSAENDTVQSVDFKKGLNKITLEYEGNDEDSVLNFFLDTGKYPNEYFDLYIADMTVTCEERAIVRTDYYAPTNSEMLADGGYTWDFSNNNLLELTASANVTVNYRYLCEMTETDELNAIRRTLVLERAYGSYALNLQIAQGSHVLISSLTDNLEDGYVYEISFNAYRATPGHVVIIPYDTANTANGQENRSAPNFQITDNGNGTYNYVTWITASTDFNAIMLYAISACDLYISDFTVEMYEPMDELTETGTVTPIMMSQLNQGTLSDSEGLPVGGFIDSGKTKDDGTALQYAYWLTDRTANNADDVTLDLYEFGTGGLAHNGKRFKSITVTVYYYVQTPATASRVYISHDGHDISGALDLSTAGYKTATYTWGYDVGLLDLQYLGIRKADGSFGRFCVGSIEYSITYLTELNEEVQELSYNTQVTASATPQTDGYTSYTAASVVAENATVTALSNSSLQVTTETTKAGVWLEVPSTQFTAGQNVHLSFDLTTDTANAVNGYATVKLYNDGGEMLDWAYPAGATSKVNYDTAVVEKSGKLYVYAGLRDTKGSVCTVSDITVDGDVTPTGDELFGGTKLIQTTNKAISQMEGYLFKTWDDKLVIIDGGTYNEMDALATHIRENTTLNTTDNKYHVDAWFLTHYHNDHVWALLEMLKNDAYNDIVIDKLYYDFQGAQEAHDTLGKRDSSLCGTTDENGTTYQCEYEGILIPLLKAINQARRTGQILDTSISFADADDTVTPTTRSFSNLGVLYETSSIKVKALNWAKFDCDSNYVNNSSVVYKVETYNSNGVQKESVLFLGDLGNYGDTLIQDATFLGEMRTCRVIQMAHHGQAGTSQSFYQAIDDIRICLYPAPDWLFDVFSTDNWGAGLGSTELIGTATYGTLTTRAWMREMGVRYSYTMADDVVTLG